MDTDDTTLLRDALDRTTDGLPPLPDLAPLAVREGRRRRARARIAVAATAFGVVTAGALGLTLLAGTTGPGVSTPAAGSARTSYPPVVVEETPGVTPPDNPEGLSEAERERRAQHQQKMAALLDELLPPKITDIRPVKDRTGEYRITAGGETFRMIASVRPANKKSLQHCENKPKDAPTCEEETRLRSGPISDWPTWRVTNQYWYRKSVVALTVYAGKAKAPVTLRDLFDIAEDPRFLELVKDADAHPVEAKEPPFTLTPVSPGEVAELSSGKGQRAR
ncbi:hypothetical protein [Streptomyces sp. WAC01280]|uniref:hypothetical protein n=1 Tax=Streptomyces sp. WAC01280 TaxID=2487424 RepID=UPI000F775BF1|nr:hypothetical protein [Streptomyces sp. WAC01280]RSS54842.1 hypothetical protein EF909_16595 [Streptomyces sp. WAC01280]